MDTVDHIQELADNVRNDTTEMCATVAELMFFKSVNEDFDRGYAAARTEIAAKIRETKKGKR